MQTIVAGVFLLIGGLMFVAAILEAVYAMRSREWPVALGKIVRSAIEDASDSEHGRQYAANVLYRYPVNGEELTGSRRRFGELGSTSWKWPARRVIERYPFGAPVNVHYDPDDPAKAVLEPGLNGGLLVFALCGAAFAAIGLAGLLQ